MSLFKLKCSFCQTVCCQFHIIPSHPILHSSLRSFRTTSPKIPWAWFQVSLCQLEALEVTVGSVDRYKDICRQQIQHLVRSFQAFSWEDPFCVRAAEIIGRLCSSLPSLPNGCISPQFPILHIFLLHILRRASLFLNKLYNWYTL